MAAVLNTFKQLFEPIVLVAKKKGMNGLSKYQYNKELYGICLVLCRLKCLEYNIVKDQMNMANLRL